MNITTNLNRSSICNKGSLTHPLALVQSNPFLYRLYKFYHSWVNAATFGPATFP